MVLWGCAAAAGAVFILFSLQAEGVVAGPGLLLPGAVSAAFLLSVFVCFLRVALVRKERAAWSVLGAAMIVQLAGWIAYWLLVDGRGHISYPSWADAFWLSGYVLNYVALLILLRGQVRRLAAVVWFDGAVGVLALGALSAATVVAPILDDRGNLAAVVTGLAYPLCDLVLLALVVTVFVTRGWAPGRTWVMIGGAFLLQAVAGGFYLVQSAEGTYGQGTLLDLAWPLSTLLVAYAAWQRTPRLKAVTLDGWSTLAPTGLAAVVALGLLVRGSIAGISLAAALLATATLLAVCGRGAWTFLEMTRLSRRHQEARSQALTDYLTGLGNHRAFHEDLALELERGSGLSLAMLDLVGLKLTNDAAGHQAGDERLRDVAQLIEKHLPRRAKGYRTGGDEFAILLGGSEAWDAFAFVQRLQHRSEAQSPLAGVPAVSAGVAEAVRGLDKDALLHRADLALMAAKRSHLRAVLWSPDLERAPPLDDREGTRQQHLRTLATSLARAVDAKDSYTRSHCETVATLSVMIAEGLGLPAERIRRLRLAGLLHDVGKIGIPDHVLQKPGPLTDEEYECMKSHATLGHNIISGAELNQEADWILHHHERVDGRGYPEGLAGAAIPLESRIILVADAFEAMTSDRPYRAGSAAEEALVELRRHAGAQFDPDCVEALEEALGRFPGASEAPAPVGLSAAAA